MDIKDQVLFEDNHIIAINKLSSQIVQGDKTNDPPVTDFIKEYIAKKYDKTGGVFLGVPHRLDRPTSGVVVFARTSKSLTRITKLFRDKEVKKTYWAIVEKCDIPEKGTLTNHLAKTEKINKSFVTKDETKGKVAILHYTTIKKLDNYFLLEITLETGRHHQIRTQLAHIGAYIKGDVKYGARRGNKNMSIHLHARQIEFMHPVKKEPMNIVAPVPQNDPLWKVCEQ